MANPAWQFGEVAIYLWIVLGLAAGLTTVARDGAEEGKVSGAVGNLRWMRPFQIVAALSVCVWVVYEAVTNARLLPTPHL